MTLKECYEKMGADYSGVLSRLMNDSLVSKFVKRFPDDKSFEELKKHLEDKNTEEAFRAAHTLKGVAANLGFTKLFQASSELTEVLRTGSLEGTQELLNKVSDLYNQTIEAIRSLDQ